MYLKLILFSTVICLQVSCNFVKNESEDLPEIYSNGARLDYFSGGQGDTVLLFVHGWSINKSYWENQVDFFKSNYRIVTMDLPGHGLSGKDREDWSMEAFGHDLVTLIDVLDLRNVVLIGHSMGGNIILQAATQRPEQVIGFVGVDNFKDVGAEYTYEQSVEINQFMVSLRQDYKTVAKGFAESMLFAESTSPAVAERVTDDILAMSPEVSVKILESVLEGNDAESKLLKDLRLQVHLINSDTPPTNELPLRRYCNYNYALHSVGPTGHYPMIEDPEQFNSILEQILREL